MSRDPDDRTPAPGAKRGPSPDVPAVAPPVGRRDVLFRLGLAINAIAAAIFALPILGYVVSPMRRRAWQAWVPIGSVDAFPVGQTRLATYRNPFVVPWDGVTADVACWVRRISESSFQVFAVNCAHLGCPVRWFPESKLFMCPCHGGAYYEDGKRASGPPPRGLFEYEYKLEGGQLVVRGGQIPTLSEPV